MKNHTIELCEREMASLQVCVRRESESDGEEREKREGGVKFA